MTSTFSKTIAPQRATNAPTETAIIPVRTTEQPSGSARIDAPEKNNSLLNQWHRLVTATNEWREDKNLPKVPEGSGAKAADLLQSGRAYIKSRSFSDFAVWFTAAHIAALALALVVGPNSALGTISHLLSWVALTGAVLKSAELALNETRCRVVPYFQGAGTDA